MSEERWRHPLIPRKEELNEKNVPGDLRYSYCQMKYRMQFGMSSWYSKMKDHTFRSSFIELSEDEVLAVLESWRSGRLHRAQVADVISGNPAIKSIAEKLRDEMKSYPNGVFVRLETRSPKDSLVNFAHDTIMHDILEKELRDTLNDPVYADATPAEISLGAFMRMLRVGMKSSSAEDILFLLLNSQRIHDDLTNVRILSDFGISNSIVLREWNDEVVENTQMEFRGFVYRNELNALSQYDYMQFHPQIAEIKEDIAERVKNFFETEVKDALREHDTYVIDIFIGKDGIKVVELNSFEAWTGACLFTWSGDSNLFMNGPFEFRVVESAPSDDIVLMIPKMWRGQVSGIYPNVKEVIKAAEENEREKKEIEEPVQEIWDEEDKWYWSAVDKCVVM